MDDFRNAGTPLQNIGALEQLLDEHAAGEHRIPHPDCAGCRAASKFRRGELP